MSFIRKMSAISFVVLIALASIGAGAAAENPAVAANDSVLPLAPDIKTGRLANGLTYFIRTNSRPENRVELRLVVNAGAVLEDDDQRGLAHFVEHMAFNGSRHFKKQELVAYLESIGMRFGADINAYTNFDETVYMLEVPTDDTKLLKKGFVILGDWAHGVSFDDDEIEKERGVVLEERRSGRGAGARMFDEQLPILFKDSRYAERLTIGTEESLKTASPDAVRRFYRDWYRPDLMTVIAVGDFAPRRIEKLIKKNFSKFSGPEEPRERELFPVPDHAETLTAIATDPEATSTSVGVYYKLEKRPDGSIDDYRRGIVEGLYHSMFNARLDELRQRPDPPFLFGFSGSGGFVRSRDVYSQSVRVSEGGLVRGLDALLTEVERVERHGFTQTELDRAKKEMLRRYERLYAERDKARSGQLANELVRHFLRDEPAPGIEIELEMVREFLPTIELDELNRLAQQWITEQNRVVMVSAPEGVDGPTIVAADVLAPFEAVTRKEIEAWVDQVRDAPLVAEPPKPGTIVEENRIAEIGVTTWELSNGVRVVLKPTEFQNDEIQLSGFSPGGHSLVSDDRYISASFATSVLQVGGLGEFNQIELEKAMAGKVARASGYVGETEEGMRGSASPEDVEAMFQLLYLSFTAPRADKEAFEAWRTRTAGRLENRLARPETVFRDEMTLRMYQGHPRRKPTSKETIEQVDLDVALDVYRDRFADAGDFTFVVVGNFDPETLKPLVLTYLGGLPATGREETWRDVGAVTPDDVVEFSVKKGLESKSRVQITFSGDATWSRQNSHDISSLSGVMRIRLREVLREDMGATYGVSVYGGISRRPTERYSFTISFGCGPENVDDMIAATFAEIESIKSGIDSDYIDKVREIQTRGRETALQENRFWLGTLGAHYRYDTDPRLVLEYDELVASVSAERVGAAAKLYLDKERYVQGVLYPEEIADADQP